MSKVDSSVNVDIKTPKPVMLRFHPTPSFPNVVLTSYNVISLRMHDSLVFFQSYTEDLQKHKMKFYLKETHSLEPSLNITIEL